MGGKGPALQIPSKTTQVKASSMAWVHVSPKAHHECTVEDGRTVKGEIFFILPSCGAKPPTT